MRNTVLILATTALATGCGTGPDDPLIASYQVFMYAVGSDTTAERVQSYDCIVTGSFTINTPVPPSATVHFPLNISRTLSEIRGTHREFTSADSTVGDAVLEYSGLGEASLSFSLTAGPYVVSLGPGANVPATAEYTGPWTCGPDLPLAQDSTLNAYGYDGSRQISGDWRISENFPID
jgi:hypothetical protein